MRELSNLLYKKQTVFTVAVIIALSIGLVFGLLSSIANAASSIVRVQSNIAEVATDNNASFVITVGADNEGDVYELEVDHWLDSNGLDKLPEFSVYADEANPYGDDAALFNQAGVTVTYSAANSQWVIDFGSGVTNTMRDNLVDGKGRFNFALRDSQGTLLWGSMNNVTPENTFVFNFETGEGDSLVPPADESDDEEDEDSQGTNPVVPGVPNTSVAL